MKISLLLTGNELMSGDTVDSNSAYIAQSLKDLGLVPYLKQVVGDDMQLLVSSIKDLASVSDVLVVNGGLGPTVDDLTAQALAQAANSPLIKHPEAFIELSKWAEQHGFKITESNLTQAYLPEICQIIENPHGSAVGFKCLLNDCLVICTPGVPSEFKPMVEAHVLPLIRTHGGVTTQSKITRLRLFGITESGLQDAVNELFPDWPVEVDLGFRVQMPILEVKITTVGSEFNELNKEWTHKFEQCFLDYIVGRDSTSLPEALNKVLLEKQVKVAAAESCTGGLIASMITSEAGSSAVFEGGFVTYSNAMKHELLDVSNVSLETYGAVSEQVVKEMVCGVLNKTSADIAIATSGIAGPEGGTEDKPIGTVWIAIGDKSGTFTKKLSLPAFSRQWTQKISAAIAIDLVRRYLLELPTDVGYFNELKK